MDTIKIIAKRLLALLLAISLSSSAVYSQAGASPRAELIAEEEEGQKKNKRRRYIGVALLASGAGILALVGGSALVKYFKRLKIRNSKIWQDGLEVRVDPIMLKRSLVSKFGHYEMTGTVEAKSFMEQLQRDGHQLHETDVAVFDSGFTADASGKKLSQEAEEFLNLKDDYQVRGANKKPDFGNDEEDIYHGMKVASLIAGRTPIGASTNARIKLLSHYDLEKMADDGLPSATIVNFSFTYRHHIFDFGGIGSDKATYAKMKKEAEHEFMEKLFRHQDTVVVQAASNDFPFSTGYLSINLGKIFKGRKKDMFGERVIQVGSVDEMGVVSAFSESSDNVVVLAPGDFKAVRAFDGKKTTMFGGTSASTPLVSAALADVAAFLPRLHKNEAEHLLRQTAIKTSTNEVSELNGAGVLNHYKLLRVAERLAEHGWPQNREMLFDEQLYDFSDEAHTLLKEAQKASNDDTLLQQLRTAFFLDPDNNEIRTQLATIYRKAGLKAQALFYEIPAKAVKQAEVRTKLAKRASYATSDSKLLNETIDEINVWIKSSGRSDDFVNLEAKDFSQGQFSISDDYATRELTASMSAYKKDMDELENLLRVAEDVELRNQIVLTEMIKHANANGHDELLQLLQLYASENYPKLQL